MALGRKDNNKDEQWDELIDTISELKSSTREDERKKEREMLSTSDSKLPSTINAKERKTLQMVGQCFYKGIQKSYDAIQAAIVLKEKMVGAFKKVITFPIKSLSKTVNAVKSTNFWKMVLEVMVVLGLVYSLFKDWFDEKIPQLLDNVDGGAGFLSKTYAKISDAYNTFSDKLQELINDVNERINETGLKGAIKEISIQVLDTVLSDISKALLNVFGRMIGKDDFDVNHQWDTERAKKINEKMSDNPYDVTDGDLMFLKEYYHDQALQSAAGYNLGNVKSLRGSTGGIDHDNKDLVDKDVLMKAQDELVKEAKKRLGADSKLSGSEALERWQQQNNDEMKRRWGQLVMESSMALGKITTSKGQNLNMNGQLSSYEVDDTVGLGYSGANMKKTKYTSELATDDQLLQRQMQYANTLSTDKLIESIKQSEEQISKSMLKVTSARESSLTNEAAKGVREGIGDWAYSSELSKSLMIGSLYDQIKGLVAEGNSPLAKLSDVITNTFGSKIDEIIRLISNKTVNVVSQKGQQNIVTKSDVQNVSSFVSNEHNNIQINISTINISTMEKIATNAAAATDQIVKLLDGEADSLEATSKHVVECTENLKKYQSVKNGAASGGVPGGNVVMNVINNTNQVANIASGLAAKATRGMFMDSVLPMG